MSRILMVLMASAAIGVGVLMAGAGGSKVDVSPPAHGGLPPPCRTSRAAIRVASIQRWRSH
jgi:hypothetical protein